MCLRYIYIYIYLYSNNSCTVTTASHKKASRWGRSALSDCYCGRNLTPDLDILKLRTKCHPSICNFHIIPVTGELLVPPSHPS